MRTLSLYMYDDGFAVLDEIDDGSRRQIAHQFEKVITEVNRLRADTGGFSVTSLNGVGQIFLRSVKDCLSNSFYRLMLTKLRPGVTIDEDLDIEVSHDGKASTALTMCALWDAPALGAAVERFAEPTLPCILSSLDKADESVEVNMVAYERHVTFHKEFLETWGCQVSANYKVFATKDYYGMIYPGPKEHRPPHIHLFRLNGIDFAKYKIDPPELIKGEPDFSRQIIDILTAHRETLLASFERSQKGQFPFFIELVQ